MVEVDESHSVGHDRNKSIGHNETVTIGHTRLRAVKDEDILLVGRKKTDSIGTSYVIEVGENLRLVCGKSILELNASGQINLSGVQIDFFMPRVTPSSIQAGYCTLIMAAKLALHLMAKASKPISRLAWTRCFPSPKAIHKEISAP